MNREWKPGDVVRIKGSGLDTIAIWTGRFWAWSDGSGPYEGVSHCHPSIDQDAAVRPLVVIDPEDREQVERLDDLLYSERNDRDDTVDSTQAALREYANPKPPKPEEPTGLGAVVEDVKGVRWVRRDAVHFPWGNGGVWGTWDRIDAVRVLSEGVQP